MRLSRNWLIFANVFFAWPNRPEGAADSTRAVPAAAAANEDVAGLKPKGVGVEEAMV